MKKPHVVIRILLGIISVVLCIALFVGIFTAMVIGNIRVLTNKDNLQTFISEILFATPKKHAPMILRQGVGVGGVKLDDADAEMDGTQQMIVDYVYDHYNNFRLLLKCGDSGKYEDFIHNMVNREMKSRGEPCRTEGMGVKYA